MPKTIEAKWGNHHKVQATVMNEGMFPDSYESHIRLATGFALEDCCEQYEFSDKMRARQETWISYLEGIKTGRLRQPVILLIGGATCTGKSTLALDIAFRLGIRQVISTDAIREILRTIFPNISVLTLPTYRVYESSPEVEFRTAFEQQARFVWKYVIPVIERCLWGGEGLIVEGANLLPSVLMHTAPDWFDRIIYFVLGISDADVHRKRFVPRFYSTHMRKPPSRYLLHFEKIRAVNDLFVNSARKYDVPYLDANEFSQLRDQALEAVFERVATWIGLTSSA